MTVARFAISLDRELARQIRRSAAGEPTSAWLADAARRKLRSEGLMEAVRAWEAEHGEITEKEIRTVEREQMMALKRRKRRRK